MALLSSSLPFPISCNIVNPVDSQILCCCPNSRTIALRLSDFASDWRKRVRPLAASHTCAPTADKSLLVFAETAAEDQLWATASLRVRSFYEFDQSAYAIQDHQNYLAEREFEALKDRIAGKREGFGRVSCINATLPLSQVSGLSDDLCAACKYSDNGQDRVVVGTLDLNQCLRLPEEITGRRPEGIGADFARAYLSNVCVAKEMHRNGLGYELVAKSIIVAKEWGITDLYVHVVVDNEAAKKLYSKSGFIFETEEPAWQARFLDRPRRLLLWHGLVSLPPLTCDPALISF